MTRAKDISKIITDADLSGTLDVTGVLTADSNVVIAGNLTVNGSTVTNSSTNTTIEDALIELGTGTTGTAPGQAPSGHCRSEYPDGR